MKDKTTNSKEIAAEQPVEEVLELADAELEKISGGMLACNKLTPCI